MNSWREIVVQVRRALSAWGARWVFALTGFVIFGPLVSAASMAATPSEKLSIAESSQALAQKGGQLFAINLDSMLQPVDTSSIPDEVAGFVT